MSPNLIAVLDASALLAYIKGEIGAAVIETIIEHGIMTVVNMIEVVIVLGRINPSRLTYYQMAINELVRHKYESDSNLLTIVSDISVKHRKEHNLSLGDCYCLALGRHLDLPIYTGDRSWTGLQDKLNINIEFIR